MIHDITIEELRKIKDIVLLDVRSENEYEEATIPGALNLPLFNNEERAMIGTTYVQISPALAKEQGLAIAGPKLDGLYNQARQWSNGRPVALFCWRGGMRSKSLATVFALMGLSVYRLQGGYKAYRHLVNDYFTQEFPFKVVVLRGNTGVGKTELLKRLRADGYPAIDLENIANNRGSVFGSVGLGSAPSQKSFESALYERLREVEHFPYIIVECESKRIGRINLPSSVYEAMNAGPQILVYDSIHNRIERLIKEYTSYPNATLEIKSALGRLTKNLGHNKIAQCHSLLELGNLEEFTEEMLNYYDALYSYPNHPSDDYDYSISHEDPDKGIKELEDYLDHWSGIPGRTTLPGIRDTAK
ncbi:MULTISPECIES: tRNA 2-selenouridine(34) synthase MnmH [Desulfitobacterium]|uniref:tRNA 2-selenouridine synthase n=1 Tax=Desulfitobacterium dehalogenans (strain ATCC 51507 / DSM 9161 / JW/IU-DC1) TaxID=756499 RepID=I4AAD4_DESDJ|nr:MULTISPECIES: tRNA 2-selenouridine(34) synthase MnmH [Desulfitobacterium]AFM00919.1 tRNA 2-selenouridine synthase [Desulfitobacterium dehalogenans ATCC 51507]